MKAIFNPQLLEIQFCLSVASAEFYELLIQFGINLAVQWVIFANIFLIILTFIMEKSYFSKRLSRRTITFNKPDLLKPSNHEQLLQELKALTELNFLRFEIGKVDYIKGHAQIRIFFAGDKNGSFNENENENDDD